MLKWVKDILDEKGREVFTIGPDQTVFEALQLMAEKDVGALVVVSEGQIQGIVSERDYARKIVLLNATSKKTRVREIMTPRVVCVSPTRSAEDCLALMTGKRCRHLPVVEDGRLAGLVSIGDAVKAVMEHREFVIGQLEQYIVRG